MKNTFYQINNKTLISEIVSYLDSVNVPTVKNKVLHLLVNQNEDTTVYKLNYISSAFGLMIKPSPLFLEVNGKTVALSYDGVMEIDLPDSVKWNYIKDIFPEEYAYYQENNDYPPPPTTREVVWILMFKNGVLIDKQEIVN